MARECIDMVHSQSLRCGGHAATSKPNERTHASAVTGRRVAMVGWRVGGGDMNWWNGAVWCDTCVRTCVCVLWNED